MKGTRSYSYYTNTRAAVLFVLPAFLLYAFFVVMPVFQSFYFAFFDWKGMETSRLRYVGLQNFLDAFHSEFFYTALKNTLVFTVANPILQLTVALALALALATYCRGYGFFKAVYFSPIILSSTAVALMWYFILLPGNGVLSNLLTSLGLGAWNRNWLVDRGVSFGWLIIINSWIYMGYYMIIFFAAVVSIDQEVLESARIDGASGLHLVRKIILPMMWPIVIVTAVMQITGNLKAFDIIWILTKGGPFYMNNVLTTLLFYEMQAFHYGLASAYSVIVFILSLVFTILSLKIMNRKEA
jgi:raffinose/stachyose/melibiose transport system permease protein